MGTITKRPGSAYYDHYNNHIAGITLVQGTLVLDSVIPVFGEVVDPDGIALSAYGKIDCTVGRVIVTDQLEDGVTGTARNVPVYSAPGISELHTVADDGDYCIGKTVEAQGTKDYLVIQTCVPFAVESET
jgi:hypothetical protein